MPSLSWTAWPTICTTRAKMLKKYAVYTCVCVVYIYFTVLCMHSNPVQGQHIFTFRGRSRRNKEDVNEVLYQEDIEVSIHMHVLSQSQWLAAHFSCCWLAYSKWLCQHCGWLPHVRRNLLYSYNWSVYYVYITSYLYTALVHHAVWLCYTYIIWWHVDPVTCDVCPIGHTLLTHDRSLCPIFHCA